MREKKWYSIVLLAVLVLGLLTACGAPDADESQPQSALVRYDHPIGISLSMAEGFTVYEHESMLGCFSSDDGRISVFFAEELRESLENYGFEADLTLEEYARLIADVYGLEAEPTVDSYGNVMIAYEGEGNGMEFSHFAYFHQNESAYWMTTFNCMRDRAEELADDFALWASTIEIPQEPVTAPVPAGN